MSIYKDIHAIEQINVRYTSLSDCTLFSLILSFSHLQPNNTVGSNMAEACTNYYSTQHVEIIAG